MVIAPNSTTNKDKKAQQDPMRISLDNFETDDLQIQKKRKYMANMHQTSNDFNDLKIPSSKMQKMTAPTLDDSNFQKNNIYNMQNLPAAGSRMPKPFKKTFVDKIPQWIQRMEDEGKS